MEIKSTDSIKLMCVLIDQNLSWSSRIKMLETKLSREIGMFYKGRSFLNCSSRKLLYFSFFFHSYLSYANVDSKKSMSSFKF